MYLGFSMLGFYDMYIPRFLKTTQRSFKGGSLISTFIFGAVTGSIASPCISPGLALLLTIVATLGNKLLGFLMLFVFGIGLSLPLLIVGTFSSSLNALPQSGVWMVEVKKFFGFMLFAMCFYFLSNILPFYILVWMIAATCFLSGIFYLKSISPYDSSFWKKTKNLFGFAFIAGSVVVAFIAIKETFFTIQKSSDDSFWLNDYSAAYIKAVKANKKIFVDVGAEWCSICKAIDKLVLSNKDVKKALSKFIRVKIDATDGCNKEYSELQRKFNIIGVPTLLLVDPKNENVLQRWDSRVYSQSRQSFIDELDRF